MRALRKFAVVVTVAALALTGCRDGKSSSDGQAGASAPAAAQAERHYQVSDRTSGTCSTSDDDGLITAADVAATVGHETTYHIFTCLVVSYTQQNFVFENGNSHPSINFGSVKGQGAVSAWKGVKSRVADGTLTGDMNSITTPDGQPLDEFHVRGFMMVICTNCDDASKAIFVILLCVDVRTDQDYSELDDEYVIKLGGKALRNILEHT